MTILRRITKNEFQSFLHDYYHAPELHLLRMGQAFLNRFYPHITDHELFYEQNDTMALMLIERHYVEKQEAA